ncbi:MAG TPA: hypothetical protein VMW86_09505 [Dehalococcoidales bacterium]|nr:hypothetical protein [Dehalococcoidales bacterium]
MRVMSVIVVLLGLASLVLGVLFITQAASAEQEVADTIAPLTLAELDAKYDAVKAKADAVRATEEPQIQAGQAMPSAMYNYLSVQRTSLGLCRTNIGVASFVRTTGIINIILGLGLVLAGMALLRKASS